MTVQVVERRAPLPRWRYARPAERHAHRGHYVRATCHRRDARGRWWLACRACFTCKVIFREWTPCGATTRAGYPCLRPVAGGQPCAIHAGRRRAA